MARLACAAALLAIILDLRRDAAFTVHCAGDEVERISGMLRLRGVCPDM